MKKYLLGCSMMVLLLCGSATIASAAEVSGDSSIKAEMIEPRAMTVKLWFKGIPPKTHKGMKRITYYKALGGYTGVYLK